MQWTDLPPYLKSQLTQSQELQVFDPLKFYVERRKQSVWHAVPLNTAQLY